MIDLNDSPPPWAGSAAIIGVSLIPLVTFWAFSLRSGGPRAQPVKVAHIFLRIALPLYFV
jgi:hypothetical protein